MFDAYPPVHIDMETPSWKVPLWISVGGASLTLGSTGRAYSNCSSSWSISRCSSMAWRLNSRCLLLEFVFLFNGQCLLILDVVFV